MMDPVQWYAGSDDSDELVAMILHVTNGGPPVEVYHRGSKIAVIIHPEEFDLLNRLVKEPD